MISNNLQNIQKHTKLFFRSIDQHVISRGKHFYFKQIILHKQGIADILKRYKGQNSNLSPIGKTSPIWICWWQGEKNMPEIVKVCYASVKRHACEHPVILITEHNFREYTDIPEFILKKVYKGQITITHFSDLLRMELLKRHGGIWADSTIFFTQDMDKIISPDLSFYSCRHIAHNCNVVRGR